MISISVSKLEYPLNEFKIKTLYLVENMAETAFERIHSFAKKDKDYI